MSRRPDVRAVVGVGAAGATALSSAILAVAGREERVSRLVVLVLGAAAVTYCLVVGGRDERRGEVALRRGGYVFLGLSLAAVVATFRFDGETFSDTAKFALELALPWSVILWYRSTTDEGSHDSA